MPAHRRPTRSGGDVGGVDQQQRREEGQQERQERRWDREERRRECQKRQSERQEQQRERQARQQDRIQSGPRLHENQHLSPPDHPYQQPQSPFQGDQSNQQSYHPVARQSPDPLQNPFFPHQDFQDAFQPMFPQSANSPDQGPPDQGPQALPGLRIAFAGYNWPGLSIQAHGVHIPPIHIPPIYIPATQVPVPQLAASDMGAQPQPVRPNPFGRQPYVLPNQAYRPQSIQAHPRHSPRQSVDEWFGTPPPCQHPGNTLDHRSCTPPPHRSRRPPPAHRNRYKRRHAPESRPRESSVVPDNIRPALQHAWEDRSTRSNSSPEVANGSHQRQDQTAFPAPSSATPQQRSLRDQHSRHAYVEEMAEDEIEGDNANAHV